VFYLETAISVAQPFLHAVNTPQYYLPFSLNLSISATKNPSLYLRTFFSSGSPTSSTFWVPFENFVRHYMLHFPDGQYGEAVLNRTKGVLDGTLK
jgi:hypothetical protein